MYITVYSIFAKYYVLITVALFELNVYITLWPSGLYICFHGLHESHTNKFISSSSSSSSSREADEEEKEEEEEEEEEDGEDEDRRRMRRRSRRRRRRRRSFI